MNTMLFTRISFKAKTPHEPDHSSNQELIKAVPDRIQALFKFCSDLGACVLRRPGLAWCACHTLTGAQAVHGSLAVIVLFVSRSHDCEVWPRAIVELRHNPGGGAAHKTCTCHAAAIRCLGLNTWTCVTLFAGSWDINRAD